MILISCREDFTNPLDFSKADEFRDVPVPNLAPWTPLTEAQVQAAVNGKRVLLLVHGYRNSAESVAKSYDIAVGMMSASGLLGGANGYEAVLGYLWPGGWAATGFPLSVIRANRAGKRLKTLVGGTLASAYSLDIQCHSLGARVVMEALDHGASARDIWMLAGAIDDECVESGEEYFDACQRARRVYVLHSRNDRVLKFSYRLGDVPEFDSALGYEGPENPSEIVAHSPNTKVVDCTDPVNGHSAYKSAPEMYDYWGAELSGAGSPQFVKLPKNR